MNIVDFFLHNVVMFVVVFTILVFVHEMGHYLIARRFGVRVEVFSIGFGPELFGWTDRRSGTRWRVSAIPLGGYVKFFGDANAASMPGELPAIKEDERRFSIHYKNVWQRMAVAAGGPLFNIGFAVIALTAMFMIFGQSYTPPVIGAVEPGSAGAQAGLQQGDRVVEADGRSIDSFEELVQTTQLHPDISFAMVVERDGKRLALSVTPRKQQIVDRFGNTHELGELGIDSLNGLARVGSVVAGGPAERGGLKPDDSIRAIDGKPISTFEQLRQIVMDAPGKPLAFTVDRAGQTVTLTVTPDRVVPDGGGAPIGRVGVIRATVSKHRALGPVSALSLAGSQVVYMTRSIAAIIWQMIVGERSTDELGGTLRIAKASGEAAQLGWEAVVMFIIGLSISLGVFNLLPVPMLDGGHLLFYAIEAIRGRPLSARIQEYGYRIGIVLVFSLVIFTTWNDLVLLKITQFVGKLGQ